MKKKLTDMILLLIISSKTIRKLGFTVSVVVEGETDISLVKCPCLSYNPVHSIRRGSDYVIVVAGRPQNDSKTFLFGDARETDMRRRPWHKSHGMMHVDRGG